MTLGNQDVILDARVLSLGGNAAQNALQNYGLSFAKLNILEEYGLIISDFNSYMSYMSAIARNNTIELAVKYGNTYWGFVPINTNDWPIEKDLRIHGVQLSNSGKELLKIVEIEHHEQYTSALNSYLLSLGLQLTAVSKS